jgi:hypothetical protein
MHTYALLNALCAKQADVNVGKAKKFFGQWVFAVGTFFH